MSATLYAIFALLAYTAFNAVFSRTLSHVSPTVALPIYTTVVVLLGAGMFAFTRSTNTALPSENEILLLVACGLILFAADFSFVSAYNHGGSLVLVATILSLLPVTTAALNLVIEGKLPSLAHAIAFVMAVGSVFIVVNFK